MPHFDRLNLIVLVILFVVHQAASADKPSCPKSTSTKQRAEQKKDVLSEDLKVQQVSREGNYFFHVQLPVSLPHLTRIKVSLYYVRGETPTKHLADRKTVRVDRDGNITANLLGLNREPWAGCYRLKIRFDPNQQVPSVREKLTQEVEVVEREKNWYHGTPEELSRQKKKAVERAKRDFHLALSMAEELRETVQAHRNRRGETRVYLPYVLPFRFPLNWVVRSMKWRAKLGKLKASNQRRPRFDGRTVPFFYVEDRTAYFLQYDIKRLEKLYNLANRLVWTDSYTNKTVQAFRQQHQKIREGIADTMTLLKLVVPLSEDQRKEFRQKLTRLENFFQTLNQLMADGGEGEKQEGNPEQIRKTVSRIQAIILQVDSEVPDVVYKKMSLLAKRLQTVQREMNEMSNKEKKTRFKILFREFRKMKNLAVSFLEAKFQ